MSHAQHFLQRLDRVPRAHTDFALSLYRDVEALRWMLAYARLAPDEERVALSVDEARGPFIVVTRDGHFVTALAEGMSTGDLRVLSRAQIDAFAARVRDMRARKELAGELAPPGKQPVDLISLLNHRPHALSREEMRAIGGWNPIVWKSVFRTLMEQHTELHEVSASLLVTKGRATEKAKLAEEAWKRAHGLGARWLMVTMGELEWVEPVMGAWSFPYGPSLTATKERLLAPALRGYWAAARMGKPLLPIYKRAIVPGAATIALWDSVLAVTAIGLRHARLAGDARRIAEGLPGAVGEGSQEWATKLVARCVRALERPEIALDEALVIGRKVYGGLARILFQEASPYRFERDEDVPREYALLSLANLDLDSALEIAVDLLPWVARLGAPEDLYFPEEMERRLRLPIQTSAVLARIERQRGDLVTATTAVRRAEGPGRNDPCACGSGRKFKKCCGG